MLFRSVDPELLVDRAVELPRVDGALDHGLGVRVGRAEDAAAAVDATGKRG